MPLSEAVLKGIFRSLFSYTVTPSPRPELNICPVQTFTFHCHFEEEPEVTVPGPVNKWRRTHHRVFRSLPFPWVHSAAALTVFFITLHEDPQERPPKGHQRVTRVTG